MFKMRYLLPLAALSAVLGAIPSSAEEPEFDVAAPVRRMA